MSPILLFLYVAVVIDTDGSAFITKAEFDSLKNNFQAQIDNYNSSIDSKIDGAIASYLAGVRISKTQMLNTLDDYSVGVRSIVADTWSLGTAGSYTPGGMNWTHGNVGLDLRAVTTEVVNDGVKYTDSSTTTNFASYITTMQNTATAFKERLITKYDTTSNQASWYGYASTKQNVAGSTATAISVDTLLHYPIGWIDNRSHTTVVGTGTEADPYEILFDVWFQTAWDNADNLTTKFSLPVNDDRTPLAQKNEPILGWGVWQWGAGNQTATGWSNKTAKVTYSYTTSASAANKELNATPTGLSFERSIDSVSNRYIILCDNDTKYGVHRLSDMDLISGWTNDRDDAFSIGINLGKAIQTFVGSKSFQWIGSPQAFNAINRNIVNVEHESVFKAYLNGSDTDYTYFKWLTNIGNGSKTGQTQLYPSASKPYFGFMTAIDDWRNISDGNYGSLVNLSEIKAAQKEGESSTFLNHNGTELMIGAGLPVIKLEKNKEYKFKMKIDTGSAPNETGDYYIWFKDGTFTDGKKPQDESNLYTVTGISKDSTGYIMPSSVEKEITLKANNNGYLFCKWRCQALNGGGILYIDKEVNCTSQD